MSLDRYKLPLCLTEGVSFTLDDAKEVTITVKMPINSNRDFSLDWARRLRVIDNKISATPFDVIKAQRDSFFETQIIKIEGVESPDSFFKDYPLAEDEIWEKVQADLPDYEVKVEEEIKKS
jgi:hypothetical protein